jgi:hypothetical protein
MPLDCVPEHGLIHILIVTEISFPGRARPIKYNLALYSRIVSIVNRLLSRYGGVPMMPKISKRSLDSLFQRDDTRDTATYPRSLA